MTMTTAQKLELFIKDEISDAATYRQLAKMAPNEDDRKRLLEFAEDETNHAESFRYLYKCITGREYRIDPPNVRITMSYKEKLRERIIEESEAYRKYGEQYLETNNNCKLKRAYYRARTDENVHALQLIYMLI